MPKASWGSSRQSLDAEGRTERNCRQWRLGVCRYRSQAYRPIHRAQHARRIEEDALEVLLRMDCDDPVPRGLRLGGDDGQLLLQDGIQERALARVGLSNNSHIACTTKQDTAWKAFLGLTRWQ